MTDYIAPRVQQEMELAAFEKGRMQGEMEAARRIEAEQLQMQKQMPAEVLPLQQGTQLQRPDVIEINRLTWLQRAAFFLGEGCIIASLALVIVWMEVYDRDISWSQSSAPGDVSFHNVSFLTAVLGLFFQAQAITNYRAFPLHTKPFINRAWYVFLMSAAVVCFSLSLVAQVRSSPEATFWSVWHWCYALGFAVFTLHALYSIVSTLLEPLHHREAAGNYGTWSETGTHLETPEQKRDHSAYNHLARTVYTVAPKSISRGSNLPPASANVGAEVPVAPANAPRFADNPNTHAEDYWLLPRAKWATVAYWCMGVSVLMMIAQAQALLASGRQNWAQADAGREPLSQDSNHAGLMGALGLVVLGSLIFMSYAAMPPRTALVKNGILVDPNNRRASISQNAPTRLGPNMV